MVQCTVHCMHTQQHSTLQADQVHASSQVAHEACHLPQLLDLQLLTHVSNVGSGKQCSACAAVQLKFSEPQEWCNSCTHNGRIRNHLRLCKIRRPDCLSARHQQPASTVGPQMLVATFRMFSAVSGNRGSYCACLERRISRAAGSYKRWVASRTYIPFPRPSPIIFSSLLLQ